VTTSIGRLLRRPFYTLFCILLVTLFALGAWMAGRQVLGMYHYRAGRDAVERYHTQESVQHLQACLEIWPNDPDVLVLAARSAWRMDAFEDADRLLQRARGKQMHYDPVLERLLLRAARGELDQVEKTCQARIERDDPHASLIFEALVTGALHTFRMRYAQNILTAWLERDPDNPMAHYCLGLVFEFMTARQEAAVCFRRTLELDPEFHQARLQLATFLLDRLDCDEAIQHLEYLRKKIPGTPRILVTLAQCHYQKGRQTEAEALLDEALAEDPNCSSALSERGKLLFQDGKIAAAEPLLRRASQLEPSEYATNHLLFQCLSQLGRTQESVELQKHIAQIERDVLLLQDIVQKRMPQSPNDVALHYEAGQIAMRAGRSREALRWFDSALRLEPNHAATHRAMAEYLQKTGQVGEAQKHWEIAKSVDPQGTSSRPPIPVPKN
jgi:tetratricopeptide (TPR) repeat protein